MAFPVTINKAFPAGLGQYPIQDSEFTIEAELRKLKQDVQDLLGIPDNIPITASGVTFGASGIQSIVLPQENIPLTPTLAFGDGDTGFYEAADDEFRFAVAGVIHSLYNPLGIRSGSTSPTFQLVNETATATNPVYALSDDVDTGVGSGGDDQLSLIAGAQEGLRLTEASSGVIPAWHATIGITAFATGGQASATLLVSAVNEIGTVATTGDSVKLPSAVTGMTVKIHNKGANACDVFPNTSDDIEDATVNTAVSLAANAKITYIAVDVTTWESF